MHPRLHSRHSFRRHRRTILRANSQRPPSFLPLSLSAQWQMLHSRRPRRHPPASLRRSPKRNIRSMRRQVPAHAELRTETSAAVPGRLLDRRGRKETIERDYVQIYKQVCKTLEPSVSNDNATTPIEECHCWCQELVTRMSQQDYPARPQSTLPAPLYSWPSCSFCSFPDDAQRLLRGIPPTNFGRSRP